MKKIILAICCVLATVTISARPYFRSAPPPRHAHRPFRPVPPPPPRHHHGYHVPGFWPGFVGGALLGTAISSPRPPIIVPPPAVVVPPPATRQVWIEGRYVDVMSPNGIVTRQWQSGHWEYRPVVLP